MSANTASPDALVTDADLKSALRAHITIVLMARVCVDDARRTEALRDYLAVTQAVTDVGAADTLAMMVPPLMPSLYRRWIGMFAERLFETAPQAQLEILCDGSEENGGALALAFVMFLESARMEKQMAEDLKAFSGAAGGGGEQEAQLADLAASYLRARVVRLAEKNAGPGATANMAPKGGSAKKGGQKGRKKPADN
ncbi:MAG: hypothetical protein AUJ49_00790 [Desulfovibrionaceae bacterium CG1_02_65_16]|nr:MAG: hypothetical protein AUJ49_00790 [Desulfovibrionaceae bacterium CG1_02_65_16]